MSKRRKVLGDDELKRAGASLPDKEQVYEAVHEITGRGRPRKKGTVGRVKFTTSIKQELVKTLKMAAIEKGCTAADLLEEILVSHFSNKI